LGKTVCKQSLQKARQQTETGSVQGLQEHNETVYHYMGHKSKLFLTLVTKLPLSSFRS